MGSFMCESGGLQKERKTRVAAVRLLFFLNAAMLAGSGFIICRDQAQTTYHSKRHWWYVSLAIFGPHRLHRAH